ncbi:DNA topoisomerase [Thioalkalivibrio thiocyanodenitrificans]|uniref:DNA topoisomerase n=1 Tax=Thioalkalivibrio thiocyanodenitrificans TaxID=243063 RepID=UPI00036AE616|nr:DNA topoisomerase [Thioalkalivibrio thiocyanodenitrificans]
MADSTEKSSGEEQILPPVSDGEMASVLSVSIKAKKTKPPARYSEGTLVDDMEAASKFVAEREFAKTLKQVTGLGTGATRASIIETLKRHGLLINKGKHIISTDKGRELIEFLPESLYDVAETARWEAALQGIQEGKLTRERFEAALVKKLSCDIETLKGLARPSSTTHRGDTMSGAPTEKQIAFAQKLAAALNLSLPENCETDAGVCRKFLDEHASKPFPPSEKQLEFAKSIAERKGVSIPAKAMRESKTLSQWIDQNKD